MHHTWLRSVPCLLLIASTTAQQFDEMLLRSLPSPREGTTCVLVADLDGDGDLDVVCGGGNRFYRNRGDGIFIDDTADALPANLGWTGAIVCGDFDGDGDPDLALGVGYRLAGQDRLLRNDGTGHFTDVTATHMPVDGDPTVAVASGDIDGDGDLDLVFGNYGIWTNPVRVYANDGTGTFTDVTSTTIGTNPPVASGVALVDTDQDGDLDLLVNDPVRLFRNQGGVFTDVSASHVPAGFWVRPLVVTDIDNDGDPDVYGGGLLQNQAGTFVDVTTTHLPPAGPFAPEVALALDIDQDGDVDFVEPHRTLRNTGNGVFVAAPAPLPDLGWAMTAMHGGDVDGDGTNDLVIGADDSWFQGGHTRMLLGDGTGAFTDVTPVRLEATPITEADHLVPGDFDGDGDVDLAAFGRDALLWRNDGGWFTNVTPAGFAQSLQPTTAATTLDVDGDGDLDFVLSGIARHDWWRNDGGWVFAPGRAGVLPSPFAPAWSTATGDFDRDGDVDLVYAVPMYSPFILENVQGRNFVPVLRLPLTFGLTIPPATLAVGDIDADGDLDLVAGLDGLQNQLFRNRGNGFFTDSTASLPADLDRTMGLALVDVDGDGDLDLYCANAPSTAPLSGQDRLYRNDGTGTFTDVTTSALPNDTHFPGRVVAGDVDGDGDADILMTGASPTSPSRLLYCNDGTGRFTDTTARDWPLAPDHGELVLADFDRDGDPDVASGTPRQRVVAMNLTRQLHAPWPARIGRRFALEVVQRAATGPGLAVPFLSTTLLGGVATPIGLLGIAPMLSLPPVAVPYPNGAGTVQFTLPAAPALIGATFHAQALLVAAPGGVHLTNVTSSVILR